MTSDPKNIIICFDGTGNEPSDANEEPAKEIPEDITNVAKLHILLGGDFENNPSSTHYDIQGQHSLYYKGVATEEEKPGIISGIISGLKNQIEHYFAPRSEIEKIVQTAVEDLKSIYNPGDNVFVIGFSRGAATARIFCGTLAKDLSDAHVKFLICFDTVASIGIPDISNLNRPKSEVLLEDYKLAPNVAQALHCCSIGENCKAFQPTLMNREDKVTEVWFAGAHKDCGGGYHDDKLSDVTLQFVLDEIKIRDFGLQVLSSEDVKFDDINKEDKDIRITKDNITVDPDAVLGVDHTAPMTNKLMQGLRKVAVIEEDKIVKDALPVVHYSVAQRITSNSVEPPYRPSNLDIPHKLLMKDGSYQVKQGLDDYLPQSTGRRMSSKRKLEELISQDIAVRSSVTTVR